MNHADVLSLIQTKKLEILRPNAAEQALFVNFPRKLAAGEKEAIAVCLHRHLLFITHDRRAADYCDHSGIECIRLKELLARLLQINLITQVEIDEILN